MYVSDFNIIICLSTISLPSPQPVSNSAVCLCKFHWLRCNILIINIDKFLQRGGVLTTGRFRRRRTNRGTQPRAGCVPFRMGLRVCEPRSGQEGRRCGSLRGSESPARAGQLLAGQRRATANRSKQGASARSMGAMR